MNKPRTFAALVIVVVMMTSTIARAQDIKAPITPLRVLVVISKFQGEKKISSLPYTLTFDANDPQHNRASLRMGTQIPIVTTARPGGNADAPLVPTVQYRDVGMSIDCTANSIEEGRFKLDITIDDSSVYTDAAQGVTGTSGHPAFRSFRSSDVVLLRDGQSAQYTSATDRVNGEVIKVDVTLTVVK